MQASASSPRSRWKERQDAGAAGGIPLQWQTGRGVLVDSTEAAAKALVELLADSGAERDELGRNGRERIHEHFLLPILLNELVLLNELAGDGGTGSATDPVCGLSSIPTARPRRSRTTASGRPSSARTTAVDLHHELATAPDDEGRRLRVDLYWLPLGAGGHSVRLNGRVFEAIAAPSGAALGDLYHSALEIVVPEGRFVVEQAPARSDGVSVASWP